MMVLEVVATGSCNGVEVVIGQGVAELSAGGSKGVIESIVGIVHLIDLEHRFQAPFIEAGIMVHERNGSYLVAEIIDCLLVREEYIGYLFF